MKRNGKPRGSTNTKPIEVMMGRRVIRGSAPSLTLGSSAAAIAAELQARARKEQGVPQASLGETTEFLKTAVKLYDRFTAGGTVEAAAD